MITFSTLKYMPVNLEQLYSEQKQLRVHLSDSEHEYTLVLIGRDKEPDFLLSSFSGNYYVRSGKGMNRQKYTTLQGIENAVKRLVKSKIVSEGVISFSLSDKINPF